MEDELDMVIAMNNLDASRRDNMDLRENIAELIWKSMQESHLEIGNNDSLEPADAILALPSGLVAVKECDYCGGVHSCVSTCDKCHGSGRIVRPLSIKEALEQFNRKVIADIKQQYYDILLLPSGERVEADK